MLFSASKNIEFKSLITLSKISARFVLASIRIPSFDAIPSISTNSWFKVCSDSPDVGDAVIYSFGLFLFLPLPFSFIQSHLYSIAVYRWRQFHRCRWCTVLLILPFWISLEHALRPNLQSFQWIPNRSLWGKALWPPLQRLSQAMFYHNQVVQAEALLLGPVSKINFTISSH